MTFVWPASFPEWLLVIVSTLGIVWYYICIIRIGTAPWHDPDRDDPAFREFMSVSITSISVTLATFVGMVLGFRGVNEQVKAGVDQAAAVAGNAAKAVPQLELVARSVSLNAPQVIAAVAYVGSLVLALYFWYRGGRRTDPAISKLGQSLLGLIAGALAVILNIK